MIAEVKSSIYTIGHGNKTLPEFIEELKLMDIEYLFDVRSFPISKFNPQFNKPVLDYELPKQAGITYVFLGKHLGGLPKDRTCFTENKVDYKKIREKDFFQEGVNLLVDANSQRMKVALMCSETKPEECHRSKLIGQELLLHNISLNHITPEGIKSQKEVITELTKGLGTKDLFGEIDFTSRKDYE